MSAGIAVETARIRTAPKGAPTPLRSLTHPDRQHRSEGSMQPIPALSSKDIDRFWSKVHKTPTCWHWTAAVATNGYGRFYTYRDRVRIPWGAHRTAFALSGGELDPTLVIDHICRNRTCVNPEHLRQVDNRENVLAGIGPTAINARRTHCPQGHEYTPENTLVRPKTGWRRCRTCHAEEARRRRARRNHPSDVVTLIGGEE